MKKVIIFTLVLLLPLLVGCRTNQSTEGVRFEYLIPRQPFRYANAMRFMFSYYAEGNLRISNLGMEAERLTRPYDELFDENLTEFIFFHSAEEAYGHPQHVVAAWPNDDFIPGLILGFHWAINRTGEDRGSGYYVYDRMSRRSVITSLEEWGLSYPITRCDFVDNWEAIHRLWLYLHNIDRDIISRTAVTGFIADHIFEMFP